MKKVLYIYNAPLDGAHHALLRRRLGKHGIAVKSFSALPTDGEVKDADATHIILHSKGMSSSEEEFIHRHCRPYHIVACAAYIGRARQLRDAGAHRILMVPHSEETLLDALEG